MNVHGITNETLKQLALGNRFQFPTLVLGALFSIVIWLAFMDQRYFPTDFLYRDDTIYLSSYLFDKPLAHPSNAIHYILMMWSVEIGGVIFAKFLPIIYIAVIIVCFSYVLLRCGASSLLAVLLAICIVYYPASRDQLYFVAGSHPTAATAFFSIYLVLLAILLGQRIDHKKPQQIIILGVGGIFLLICTLVSPLYTLAPLIGIFLSVYLVYRDRYSVSVTYGIAYIVIGILPSLIALITYRGHHYDQVGWMNYSVRQIFTNFVAAIRGVSTEVLSDSFLVVFGILTVAGLIGVVALLSRPRLDGESRRRWRYAVGISSFCILSAAITFGPGSVVTGFAPRYLWASFLLLSLGIAALAVAMLRNRDTPRWSVALTGVLLLVATASVVENARLSRTDMGDFLSGHDLLVDALADRDWQAGDQILVFLPPGIPSTTAGLNHWSTWYLRTLTHEKDVIGLVGDVRQEEAVDRYGLFVENYVDHTSEQWTVRNGRPTRKTMLGLERDRPLFAFSPDSDGNLKLRPVLLWEGPSWTIVEPGHRPEGGGKATAAYDCSAVPDEILPLAIKPELPTPDGVAPLVSASLSANGAEVKVFTIKPEDDVFSIIRLELESPSVAVRTRPVSRKYPPMPALGPAFAVSDLGNVYFVSDRSGTTRTRTRKSTDPTSIVAAGCPGRFAVLLLNQEVAGFLRPSTFSGRWQIGKGVYKRFWKGDIREFSVGVFP